jgi:hypothetical protein
MRPLGKRHAYFVLGDFFNSLLQAKWKNGHVFAVFVMKMAPFGSVPFERKDLRAMFSGGWLASRLL